MTWDESDFARTAALALVKVVRAERVGPTSVGANRTDKFTDVMKEVRTEELLLAANLTLLPWRYHLGDLAVHRILELMRRFHATYAYDMYD